MLTKIQTDVEISHPDVVFYDYYGAWNTPIPSDKEVYFGRSDGFHFTRRRTDSGYLNLANRTGPLAQAAPNIGPIVRLPPLTCQLVTC